MLKISLLLKYLIMFIQKKVQTDMNIKLAIDCLIIYLISVE